MTEANGSERLGAVVVLHEAVEKLSKLEVVWVDQGYSGKNFARAVKQVCGDSVQVEVIERKSQELEILPKRWTSLKISDLPDIEEITEFEMGFVGASGIHVIEVKED